MSNYAKYRGRDSELERADLEREIELATRGFSFLRDFPEFAKSVQLAKAITLLLETVPPSKYLGWADQIERASVSTCCNIAEAVGRGSLAQLAQYLRIAKGSAYETMALLFIAPVDVSAEVKDMGQEVCRLIDLSVKAVAKDRLDRL